MVAGGTDDVGPQVANDGDVTVELPQDQVIGSTGTAGDVSAWESSVDTTDTWRLNNPTERSRLSRRSSSLSQSTHTFKMSACNVRSKTTGPTRNGAAPVRRVIGRRSAEKLLPIVTPPPAYDPVLA